MIIHQDNEEWYIDVERVESDLDLEHCELHCISRVGELIVDKYDGPNDAFSGRELWMARPTGYPNAWKLAGMDFEFVRSVIMGDA